MKIMKIMAMASATLLLSGYVLAETPTFLIQDIPDRGNVALNGTVERFDGKHSFTLRDSSGTVTVDLSKTKAIVVKDGEKITVIGTVDEGLFETHIAALNVIESEAKPSTP